MFALGGRQRALVLAHAHGTRVTSEIRALQAEAASLLDTLHEDHADLHKWLFKALANLNTNIDVDRARLVVLNQKFVVARTGSARKESLRKVHKREDFVAEHERDRTLAKDRIRRAYAAMTTIAPPEHLNALRREYEQLGCTIRRSDRSAPGQPAVLHVTRKRPSAGSTRIKSKRIVPRDEALTAAAPRVMRRRAAVPARTVRRRGHVRGPAALAREAFWALLAVLVSLVWRTTSWWSAPMTVRADEDERMVLV
ncbi:hypothetical protein GGF32_009158 [Allomyces javanicus]|nr:hypothetical protein GGF32_009158 [Allomyces javanicus]